MNHPFVHFFAIHPVFIIMKISSVFTIITFICRPNAMEFAITWYIVSNVYKHIKYYFRQLQAYQNLWRIIVIRYLTSYFLFLNRNLPEIYKNKHVILTFWYHLSSMKQASCIMPFEDIWQYSKANKKKHTTTAPVSLNKR